MTDSITLQNINLRFRKRKKFSLLDASLSKSIFNTPVFLDFLLPWIIHQIMRDKNDFLPLYPRP